MQRSKKQLLLMMAFLMPFSFSIWMVLLNNFAIEVAQFTGREIGILQSLREIPGFLAFTAIFVLLVLKEQTFALISLLVLAIGITLTGFFPSVYGLYFTTVLMSVGFHYFETVNQSLTLQWIPKAETPAFMGKALAVKGAAAVLAYSLLWVLLEYSEFEYVSLYALFGGITILAVLFIALRFPHYTAEHEQHKRLILRQRYWLFYTLVFLSGARRQIFVVFAGFLMVEKFGYSVSEIALLYLANQVLNIIFAGKIGQLIGHIGERRALMIEYTGLVFVFGGYALVETAEWAAGLYIIDHLFFAMAIAIKSYFQKIADPADIASSAGVSFTINHIAAVILPALLGFVWLYSPSLVFWFGAAIAVASLAFSFLVPRHPEQHRETTWALKTQ
ncbi:MULTISPECIES: MFS transporter [unclassified Agarivorans]|uniref:MFS transporter n=1 Tax=unclassified Agarivorans TaxID=2636026 RepID=UPI0010DCDCA0|nr:MULTISPECIES: MFS transporter [unclassified Agarivorans]MDO6687017.1 MFS transporter [Agarivorans sp. 3_MG-2023]MDO6713571.1 MFS transporter [Agarivorans sp. 2_MG-2023]MDO6765164.1 MFS transporter [Agarivorans sp. 1_MG-2023]GDY27977.1 MFS transporter [Agarivorans sp. Toyoura001]